jgi:hypothetical protein
MKKELKPTNGWRTSLIFASRKASAVSSTEEKPSPGPTQPEEAFPGLSLLQRSWYLRAPQSVDFAEAFVGGKESVSRDRKVGSGKAKSRLPTLPVRRTTLIDIIKHKRLVLPA